MKAGIKWLFRRIIRIYFRQIEAAGHAPASSTGGRVFVANHVNGLVDPILVLTQIACDVSPVAKSTLWKIPGLRWLLDEVEAVPVLRKKDDPNKSSDANEAIFDRVAESLASASNILIFPEGTSHNEPHLLPVKSGAARMLARAKARGAGGLTFQAVALEFDARTLFRSRALLVYGPVREVDAIDAEGDALVARITDVLREDLSELLVEGRTWDERLLIARVAEMLANDAGGSTLERWSTIGRQVEAANKALLAMNRDDARAIGERVSRYYDLLEAEGLLDEQLATERDDELVDWSRRLGMFAIAPLALAGIALYAIPYQLPRLVASRVANDPDEISTYKLGTGIVVYPLWAAGLTGAAFVLLPLPLAVPAAGLALASPFAALAWLDKTPEIRRSLRFRRKADRLAELRAARAEAMAAIAKTRAALGL